MRGAVRPWFSCHRIERMSRFRNRYLSFIEAKGEPLDYVLVIDPDVESISIDGIANSFGQPIPWHGVTSNGKNLGKFGYLYYDTYAFRDMGQVGPQTEADITKTQKLLAGLTVRMPMIRVASAFNGLAIYKAEATEGIRYRCKRNQDDQVEAYCEHVTFHVDMAKNGYNKIFINPAQKVMYATYLGNLCRKLRPLISGVFLFVGTIRLFC